MSYPITTGDLNVLIERHGAQLDTYADLSDRGLDVEGMTEFFPDQPPLVSISKELAADPRRENRLCTTLAHEFGHVHFYGPLYGELFRLSDDPAPSIRGVCKRDDILGGTRTDWMEWQAGYVCAAILMPVSAVRDRLSALLPALTVNEPALIDSNLTGAAIRGTRSAFSVSADAARFRLLKLSFLFDHDLVKPTS